MKEKKLHFKKIFYLITLLSIVILCNLSVVQADSNAPTECRISINNNALYTNNRYVTLELYATDADAMQVWISNDGDTGTVVDFAYNKTITITDQNYTIGVDLDSTNSTTSTNSDNVLRIENWPLSSVNGTKKVYAVFRDAYGNKTSTSGLNTITISFNLNGITSSSGTPADITTLKNLAAYMPNLVSSAFNASFVGWSQSSSGSVPNYVAGTLQAFDTSTTLYAVSKTVKAGDFIYYPINRTNSYQAQQNVTGSTAKTFSMSSLSSSTYFKGDLALFKVISASSSSILITPLDLSQVFSLSVYGSTGWNTGNNAVLAVCNLYSSIDSAGAYYGKSTTTIKLSQMQAMSSDSILGSFYANKSYADKTTEDWHTVVNAYDEGGWDDHFVKFNTVSGTVTSHIYKAPYSGFDTPEYGTATGYVIPVISLEKNNVTISGIGTQASPYTISMK